jgi:hypothetical protein
MRMPYSVIGKVWVWFILFNTSILILNAFLFVVTGNPLFAGTTSEPRMAAIVAYYIVSMFATGLTLAEY